MIYDDINISPLNKVLDYIDKFIRESILAVKESTFSFIRFFKLHQLIH